MSVEPFATAMQWNILVCDDEPLFGMSLRRLLRAQAPGARVVLASEGEGPRLARGLPSVDLIVLDLYQPTPAAEQLAAFRAIPQTARTPVVVISSVGPISAGDEAVCRSADAYVPKPLEDGFFALVQQLLHR